MSGIEAILALGKKLYGDDFEIKENLFVPYREVYMHFYIQTKKGVGLVGSKGLSKSSIMRIMHILFKDSDRKFRAVTSQKLYLKMDDDGIRDTIDYYTTETPVDLYIDDLGIRRDDFKKVYGNTVSLISELLNLRYEMFVNTGARTHWSSNLPTRIDKDKVIDANPNWPEQHKIDFRNLVTLEDVYGERIVDRLIEMSDVVTFKGKSLR
jgi:hypothetical protein